MYIYCTSGEYVHVTQGDILVHVPQAYTHVHCTLFVPYQLDVHVPPQGLWQGFHVVVT